MSCNAIGEWRSDLRLNTVGHGMGGALSTIPRKWRAGTVARHVSSDGRRLGGREPHGLETWLAGLGVTSQSTRRIHSFRPNRSTDTPFPSLPNDMSGIQSEYNWAEIQEDQPTLMRAGGNDVGITTVVRADRARRSMCDHSAGRYCIQIGRTVHSDCATCHAGSSTLGRSGDITRGKGWAI